MLLWFRIVKRCDNYSTRKPLPKNKYGNKWIIHFFFAGMRIMKMFTLCVILRWHNTLSKWTLGIPARASWIWQYFGEMLVSCISNINSYDGRSIHVLFICAGNWRVELINKITFANIVRNKNPKKVWQSQDGQKRHLKGQEKKIKPMGVFRDRMCMLS